MTYSMNCARARELAVHLKAIGDTTVWLHKDDDGFPWHLATNVEMSGSFRLSMPAGCYVIAEEDGLTFKLSVEFEDRDANGTGTSRFNRSVFDNLVARLPAPALAALSRALKDDVLPVIVKNTNEIREALQRQEESLKTVRYITAYVANRSPTP